MIQQFWIRSSVDIKIIHAKFHIWAERPNQPVGITFFVWTKMYHLMDHFVEFFWMPPEMYSGSTHRCECSELLFLMDRLLKKVDLKR